MTPQIAWTRDSVIWGLSIMMALLAYLVADGRSPAVWAYLDWIKFAAATVATLSGKLASSPLPHSQE